MPTKLDYAFPESNTWEQSRLGWASMWVLAANIVALYLSVIWMRINRGDVLFLWYVAIFRWGMFLLALGGIAIGIAALRSPQTRNEVAIVALIGNGGLALLMLSALP